MKTTLRYGLQFLFYVEDLDYLAMKVKERQMGSCYQIHCLNGIQHAPFHFHLVARYLPLANLMLQRMALSSPHMIYNMLLIHRHMPLRFIQ